MKYAIGNRLNFVQFDTQFSNEFEIFLSEYTGGNNDSKYHKALSILMQIYMRAGNTGGYFLPVEEDDIIIQAKQFRIGIAELKAIYNMATSRGIFDREQFTKNHIITNSSLQITYINAKKRNPKWSMNGEYILDFVYENFKSDDENSKIVNKLEEFGYKIKGIVPDGTESKGNEEDGKSPTEVDDTDLTLTQFKLKYPNKCKGLPDGWEVPAGVSLKVIADAIKNSQKFLAIIKHMTLAKMVKPEYYEKICNGEYDDDKFDKMNAKEESNLTKGLKATANILEGLPDD